MADASPALRDADLLKASVREAGALALSLFRTELKNWTKGASSPVSEADIAVNDLIEARLRSATPDYGWLSEESVDDEHRLGKRLVWIVDPIDGTRGYLAGREDWCVSVALVEDASPLLAAVFVPVSNEFFFARRGQGATRNDARTPAPVGVLHHHDHPTAVEIEPIEVVFHETGPWARRAGQIAARRDLERPEDGDIRVMRINRILARVSTRAEPASFEMKNQLGMDSRHPRTRARG